MQYKEQKISSNVLKKKTFITYTGKSIKGHFVFDLTRSMLQKKFSRKFAKLIPNLKSRPKDIRMLFILNEFREHGIQEQHLLDIILQLRLLRSIIQELWNTSSKRVEADIST